MAIKRAAPNPYERLPPKSFWRLAVGARTPLQIAQLWNPKFPLNKGEPVATLGSCFAQHISRALVAAGYQWLNSEPAPVNFPENLKEQFHYDVFSARLGNIYTTALLKQWVSWAFGLRSPSSEIWRDGHRYIDPFRPTVEPNGFASEPELIATRNHTLLALRTMFESCGIFVFTLGLTEAWINVADQTVYPMCPGTVAGEFDSECHQFKNYSYPEVYSDLNETLDILKQHNPCIKIILTVSPVPLTATASSDHCLVATTYSKSTLRAVAGDLSARRADTDYFPSYEIISGFPFRGMFYEANMRSVSKRGVNFVMRSFLAPLRTKEDHTNLRRDDAPHIRRGALSAVAGDATGAGSLASKPDEVCEELLLDAFGGRR